MKFEEYFLIFVQVPCKDFNGCNTTELMYLRKYRKNSSSLTFCPELARRFNRFNDAINYINKHQKDYSCKMFVRRVYNQL